MLQHRLRQMVLLEIALLPGCDVYNNVSEGVLLHYVSYCRLLHVLRRNSSHTCTYCTPVFRASAFFFCSRSALAKSTQLMMMHDSTFHMAPSAMTPM